MLGRCDEFHGRIYPALTAIIEGDSENGVTRGCRRKELNQESTNSRPWWSSQVLLKSKNYAHRRVQDNLNFKRKFRNFCSFWSL